MVEVLICDNCEKEIPEDSNIFEVEHDCWCQSCYEGLTDKAEAQFDAMRKDGLIEEEM